jgi:hypothetical protein
MFVCQRHHGPIDPSSFDPGTDPLTSAVMLVLDPPECGPGSVYEEFTPRAIPAFADPQQTRLAPGGVLTWDNPQPRRKLPAILETRRIIDRGD